MSRLRSASIMAVALLALSPSGHSGELLPCDRPIEEVVDHYIGKAQKAAKLDPAPVAADTTLVRRLMLDLVGRIPTAAEARNYVESSDPRKRVRLIDALMASPGFVRHQTTELDTLLMGGRKGSLRDYLARAVGENRPWDRIFRELMLPDQTDKNQAAAAEYLRRGVADLDRLTADVSSTFFGVNISCAQCHDHPLVPDWKQDHFYGMKSFLSRTFINGNDDDKSAFLGERASGTIKFTTTEDVEKKARLMFLTGKRIDEPAAKETSKGDKKKEKDSLERARKDKLPPPKPSFSARAKLVEVALQPGERDFFARAIVNRLWYRLFGHGLVMPLDQMHSANPSSQPELLDWLAADMAAHGYDLRRLIRGLVLSAAYARDSRWDGPGDPPRPSLFAVAPLRPLTPMQMAASLRLATVAPASLPSDVHSEAFQKQIQSLEEGSRWLAQSFATSGDSQQIGTTEALLFSNNERISRELLADRPDRLVGSLKQSATPADMIDRAVRNVLSRPVDQEEIPTFTAFVNQRTDRPDDAREQLVWVLLTSPEFRFNH
jgi:hypothetical protein